MIKIAIAQINSCVGDLAGNAEKIIQAIKKAKKAAADLVIFPELVLTGYPPEDLLLKSHFIEANLRCLDLICTQCVGVVAFVGFVNKKDDKIYNSCAILRDGRIHDIYNKIALPNYGVFDEKRYFSAGQAFTFCDFKGYKFSVSICEDIWKKGLVDILRKRNIDFMINISASPFSLGKIALREKVLSTVASELNAFVIYCNLVGGQDELVFDGASSIFSPLGKPIKYAKQFNEDFFIFSVDKNRKYLTAKSDYSEEVQAFSALSLGLIDYVKKNGFTKVAVGVSGGIDSAVVVALAQIALGKDNVVGLLMPSPYTSCETLADAKTICDNLEIKYYMMAIDNILEAYRKEFIPVFKNIKEHRTEENIQSRIRGNILMAFSNRFGYLVLNTGNKSEVSCGYSTLYGDMVGGFGILKDVSKDLVYRLARYINNIAGKKIIPLSVIKRAPSAELKPNQKDSDTLPPYPVLDPILKLYIEDNYSSEDLIKAGYKKDMVRKVISMVDKNEYKRRQSPIGIKITSRAFGKDRRMPITNKFV